MRRYFMAAALLAISHGCRDEAPSGLPESEPRLGPAPRSGGELYPFTMSVQDGSETVVHAGRIVLDPPAGKYGVLRVDGDGHFRFEGGPTVKFWGVNLLGTEAIPEEEEGEELAARLAKLGANLVRFHWLDYEAIWNEAEDDLDEAQVAKLGRFIERLVERGIYVSMGLLTGWRMNRHPAIEDKTWPARSRYIVFWDVRAQALLRWYARELLTRVRVGGVPLGNHPVLAQVETVNENVIANGWASGNYRYRLADRTLDKYALTDDQLRPLYGEWLDFLRGDRGYEDDAALRAAWHGTLEEWETLEGNAVDLGDAVAATGWSLRRLEDTHEFLFRMEEKSYREFIDYLRGEGVACPITGSQFLGTGAPTLAARLKADYFNTHGYWNHHRTVDKWDVVPQLSLLEHADELPAGDAPGGAPVLRYAPNRIGGRPFVVSEYNTAYPTRFGYELAPMLAAYASFQGWDGVDYFGFAHGGAASQDEVPRAPLTMSGNVIDQVLHPVLSVAFQRGDFAPGRSVVRARHNLDTVVHDTVALLRSGRPQTSHYGQADEDFIPAWIPYVRRVERVFDPAAGSDPVPDLSEPGLYESETGELLLDKRDPTRAYFRADAPRCQIILGRLTKRPPVRLSVLSVDSESDGAVLLTSWDGAALNETRRALLVAVNHQRATGGVAEVRGEELWIEDYGTAPMLLRHMKTRVRIRSATLAAARVYALGPRGERIGIVETSVGEGALRFDLSGIDSPWFEVVVEDPPPARRD